jgi:hypothetical protein
MALSLSGSLYSMTSGLREVLGGDYRVKAVQVIEHIRGWVQYR